MQHLTVSFAVPYTCQFASTDLVYDFVHDLRPLVDDPRWSEYGAQSPQEYAHWAMRSCGVVCVKMVVEALTSEAPRTVMDWVLEGLEIDGYLTEIRHERPVEKGWKHIALAELANRHGLWSELAANLTLEDIVSHIRADHLLILSVSSELGEDGPITRQSGHLVVVTGITHNHSDIPVEIVINNPSGRTPATQSGARIPAVRFMAAFSGRGIVIRQRKQNTDTAPPPTTQS